MTMRFHFLAAAAAIGALAVPAAAQTGYPYGYQQQYPQAYPPQAYPQQAYPQQAYPGYGQPAYGYNQGYAQNPVSQIIDSLLGNRYNVTDRTAVSQCASAAMVQASAQYARYNGHGGYNQGYNHPNGYNAANGMRVTSITDVKRRNHGLRVSGLMSSGYGGQHGYQNGYQNGHYAAGDVTFRCNVAYNGAVTDIRIGRNNEAYRRF